MYKNTSEDIIKKIVLGLIALILSVPAFAETQLAVAISKLDGRAFYSVGNVTKNVVVGKHIPAGADIFTEEGAQLVFNDYYNHQYILSGSGHVHVQPRSLKLKSGYLWVQTLGGQSEGEFIISTANSEINYNHGESIISFDPYSGKTQLLVLRGEYYFKNILYQKNYVSVRDGRFSFISNNVNDGLPRKPTPIGYGSFKKITGLFKDVKTLEEQEDQARKVAENKPVQVEAPTVRQVYVDMPKQDHGFESALLKARGRVPSSEAAPAPAIPSKEAAPKINTQELLNSYLLDLAKEQVEQKKVKPASVEAVKKAPQKKSIAPKKKSYRGYKKNNVKVNIFGVSKSKVKRKSSTRAPASAVNPKNRPETKVYGKKKMKSRSPASLGDMVPEVYDRGKKARDFESKLLKEYKRQKRHDDSMNNLIDKLQSVDMDYDKDY